jgi:predicted SprT family Zn-dependent metalloprotease
MRTFLKQLELRFDFGQTAGPAAIARSLFSLGQTAPPALGRDTDLEKTARELLRKVGASPVAQAVRVEWNSRLRSCAGRANTRTSVISLNPRLREHGADEIDRTFRHELAHLLAQFRARCRRIAPHGPDWRQACADLGIPNESRCHNLPFPTTRRARPYLYRCPHCRRDFPRARRIRRAMACLPCCRKHNDGEFDARFKLQRITTRDCRIVSPD